MNVMENWFEDRKAAQVAAFFCEKAGGRIDVLKIVKLIYLSDRKSMETSAFPITNDRFVSMPHGPVNSLTMNCIDGNVESGAWSDLIRARSGYQVGLARTLEEDDIDELSDFELDILESVWSDFGGMSKWEIRDWTHAHCPEWEDPNGSSNPIPHERVLKFLGVANADTISQEIASDRAVSASFKRLEA
jgi:uncharacterized phage-associated protein